MIWFLALSFLIEENQFFGWNLVPHSGAEVVCDGIFTLLFAIAYLRHCIKTQRPHVNIKIDNRDVPS